MASGNGYILRIGGLKDAENRKSVPSGMIDTPIWLRNIRRREGIIVRKQSEILRSLGDTHGAV